MNLEDKLIEMFKTGVRKWALRSSREYSERVIETPQWNHFRISSMGSCHAAQTRDWLYPQKAKEKIDPASAIRMLMGELTHEAARHILDLGKCRLIHKEKQVRGKFPVEEGGKKFNVYLFGHIDNCWQYKDGVKVILDFKKAGETAFDSIDGGGLPDTYFDQAYGYMACSGVRRAIVLVIGTHGQIKPHYLKWEPQVWADILRRLAKIAIDKRRKRIGVREYTYGEYPCTFCSHNKDCWSLKAMTDTSFLRLGPKDKQLSGAMKELLEKKDRLKKMSTEVKDLESDVRQISLNILESAGAKKIVSDEGSLSWVSYSASKVKLLCEEAELVRKGLAEQTSYEVAYPRISNS